LAFINETSISTWDAIAIKKAGRLEKEFKVKPQSFSY
jgi:hypothetical protein